MQKKESKEMSLSCTVDFSKREKTKSAYTDELAEQFAKEAGGLAPRPNERKKTRGDKKRE